MLLRPVPFAFCSLRVLSFEKKKAITAVKDPTSDGNVEKIGGIIIEVAFWFYTFRDFWGTVIGEPGFIVDINFANVGFGPTYH